MAFVYSCCLIAAVLPCANFAIFICASELFGRYRPSRNKYISISELKEYGNLILEVSTMVPYYFYCGAIAVFPWLYLCRNIQIASISCFHGTYQMMRCIFLYEIWYYGMGRLLDNYSVSVISTCALLYAVPSQMIPWLISQNYWIMLTFSLTVSIAFAWINAGNSLHILKTDIENETSTGKRVYSLFGIVDYILQSHSTASFSHVWHAADVSAGASQGGNLTPLVSTEEEKIKKDE